MSSDNINNKRIAKNTVALYIRMLVIMAINFYMARVVLDVLGVTDYGIYNLVGTIVVIFSFLKSSLSEATQRFLNYEMGKNKGAHLQEVFSACFSCYLIFSIIVLILGCIFWFFFSRSLNIPSIRYNAASFAFYVSLLSFVFSILQVPYNASIIATEKMAFFAKIGILEAFLKLMLTFGVSYFLMDKLKLYSVLMCFNAFFIYVVYYLYCKKKITFCYFTVKNKISNFRSILSFTGWNMIGSLAGVLSESGIGLIFNAFGGVVLNTALGLSNQINNALSGFASGYQTAFKPQLVKSYAANEMSGFYSLLCRSSKFSYFLFFMLAIPIVFYMDYLLSLWLVTVPNYAVDFCRIILIGTLIDATSGVFYSSIGATGKIRNYQLAISSVFLLHFVVTFLFLYIGVPFVWVFFSRLLTRGLINFIIGLYFINKNTRMPIVFYITKTLVPIMRVTVSPICFIVVYSMLVKTTFLTMGFCIVIFELISVISILYMGVSSSERAKLLGIVKQLKLQR